jgi:mannose-1-phosphate guanylyltransferase/mannose-6-phosphate isomerase
MMRINDLKIHSTDILIEAMKKIEFNKKGFVIVTNLKDQVVGTLTDGDIRRALIEGKLLGDSIEGIYSETFTRVKSNDEFSRIIELFKSSKIQFIPIIDENDSLINVITKNNMHILLLQDEEFDINYDFLSLNEDMLEHEIYNRPWGIYKTTFLNEYSQSKIIKVEPKGKLSLQEHKRREEHWVIIKGFGEVTLGESLKTVKSGDFIYIPKGCKHRIENISESESLMIAEVQLGDYFGEDDIIRYDDIYGRI